MFRSTKSDKRFPPLLSPPKKTIACERPVSAGDFGIPHHFPPPAFPLSAGVNVPNVSPIVSLNDSPSVPATCKMMGGSTLDRLRPVGAPNPCRAPSAPSPYGGPVAVGRVA